MKLLGFLAMNPGLTAFSMTRAFVMFADGTRGHFFRASSVAAGSLGALLDMLVHPLFFTSYGCDVPFSHGAKPPERLVVPFLTTVTHHAANHGWFFAN